MAPGRSSCGEEEEHGMPRGDCSGEPRGRSWLVRLLSDSVANAHSAATLGPAVAFGAAVRRAPGPCLLITTN